MNRDVLVNVLRDYYSFVYKLFSLLIFSVCISCLSVYRILSHDQIVNTIKVIIIVILIVQGPVRYNENGTVVYTRIRLAQWRGENG